MNGTNRRVEVEYLRIIAMLMIVAHHFANHGGFKYDSVNINSVIVKVLELWGKTGVNIFVLISGYFWQNTRVTKKKVFDLIGIATFYSVVLTALCIILGAISFRKKMLISTIFPYLFGGGYWFIVIYIILYCMIPFIKAGIKGVSLAYLNVVLVAALLLFSILPNCMSSYIKVNDFGLSTLIWFIVLYLMGGQLKHYEQVIYRKRYLFGLIVIIAMIMQICACVYECLNPGNKIVSILANRDLTGIMPVVISVSLLCTFTSMKLKRNIILVNAASCTFAVYLIHDNPNFSFFMWEKICKTTQMQDSKNFLVYSICCIIGVFLCCTLIEMFRKWAYAKVKICWNGIWGKV